MALALISGHCLPVGVMQQWCILEGYLHLMVKKGPPSLYQAKPRQLLAQVLCKDSSQVFSVLKLVLLPVLFLFLCCSREGYLV